MSSSTQVYVVYLERLDMVVQHIKKLSFLLSDFNSAHFKTRQGNENQFLSV